MNHAWMRMFLAAAFAAVCTMGPAQAWSHYGVAWGTNVTVSWSIATGTTVDLTTPELDGSFLDTGGATRTTPGVVSATTLHAQANTAITQAFSAWHTALNTAGANVTFSQVTESGTLDFNSSSENPGTNVGQIRIWAYNFQGNAAGQQGYAFFPNSDQIGGDIFLDTSVAWTADSLYSVFLHELGHALGLGHSAVGGAIMNTPPPGLTLGDPVNADDAAGIADLYGGDYSDLDAGGSVMGAFAGSGSPEPSTVVFCIAAILTLVVIEWRRQHA